MNREQTETALSQLSDAHIAEASDPKPRKKFLWLAPVAAILAVVLLLILPLGPLSTTAYAISTPEYPEMAQFPTDYKDPSFSDQWSAWRNSLRDQRSQPEGYADSLTGFWASSIPVFLAGEETENRVYSPLNLYMALAMLAETAGGESRTQLLSLLGADSIESLRTQAGHVWNAHYLDDGANANILANSLWLDEGVTYNKSTLDILADKYYAGSFQGDLGSAEATEALQNWLNEQTKGLLKDQVKNEGFSPETVLGLASTIYFRTQWSEKFSEKANTEAPFHAPGGDTTVTFMNQSLLHHTYYWGEDLGAVRLGLEDGSGMWLILPDEGKTPADLLESGDALALILEEKYEGRKVLKVNLSLPKFDVVSRTDLTDGLNDLGITDVFEPGKADFSPVMPDLEDVALSEAIHAARVTVDEEGVEAAAYTLLLLEAGAPEADAEEIDFILDRPFLFVITSHDNLPLFAGVVNKP